MCSLWSTTNEESTSSKIFLWNAPKISLRLDRWIRHTIRSKKVWCKLSKEKRTGNLFNWYKKIPLSRLSTYKTNIRKLNPTNHYNNIINMSTQLIINGILPTESDLISCLESWINIFASSIFKKSSNNTIQGTLNWFLYCNRLLL